MGALAEKEITPKLMETLLSFKYKLNGGIPDLTELYRPRYRREPLSIIPVLRDLGYSFEKKVLPLDEILRKDSKPYSSNRAKALNKIGEIALRAWGKDPGITQTDGLYVMRNSGERFVIVVNSPEFWNSINYPRIVLFPEVQHIAAFLKAQEHLLFGGPSEFAPGSVGSMRFKVEGKNLRVEFIQSHYKTAKGSSPGLPRKLATIYGGWRIYAVENLIKIALDRGLNYILLEDRTSQVFGDVEGPVEMLNRPQVLADIEKACRRTGARFIRTYSGSKIYLRSSDLLSAG